MFTVKDHADLLLATDLMSWASELINGVMDRHPHDLTMQVVSFLCEAKRDADLGIQQTGMADKYVQWQETGGVAAVRRVDSGDIAEGKTA